MDDTSTRANEQLPEFPVLLDLTAERLWNIQRDFMVLRDELVKCYARHRVPSGDLHQSIGYWPT